MQFTVAFIWVIFLVVAWFTFIVCAYKILKCAHSRDDVLSSDSLTPILFFVALIAVVLPFVTENVGSPTAFLNDKGEKVGWIHSDTWFVSQQTWHGLLAKGKPVLVSPGLFRGRERSVEFHLPRISFELAQVTVQVVFFGDDSEEMLLRRLFWMSNEKSHSFDIGHLVTAEFLGDPSVVRILREFSELGCEVSVAGKADLFSELTPFAKGLKSAFGIDIRDVTVY